MRRSTRWLVDWVTGLSICISPFVLYALFVLVPGAMKVSRIKAQLMENHLLVSRDVSILMDTYWPKREAALEFKKDDKRLPDSLRRLGARVLLYDWGADLTFPSVRYRCYAEVVPKRGEDRSLDDRKQNAPEIRWSQE